MFLGVLLVYHEPDIQSLSDSTAGRWDYIPFCNLCGFFYFKEFLYFFFFFIIPVQSCENPRPPSPHLSSVLVSCNEQTTLLMDLTIEQPQGCFARHFSLSCPPLKAWNVHFRTHQMGSSSIKSLWIACAVLCFSCCISHHQKGCKWGRQSSSCSQCSLWDVWFFFKKNSNLVNIVVLISTKSNFILLRFYGGMFYITYEWKHGMF